MNGYVCWLSPVEWTYYGNQFITVPHEFFCIPRSNHSAYLCFLYRYPCTVMLCPSPQVAFSELGSFNKHILPCIRRKDTLITIWLNPLLKMEALFLKITRSSHILENTSVIRSCNCFCSIFLECRRLIWCNTLLVAARRLEASKSKLWHVLFTTISSWSYDSILSF